MTKADLEKDILQYGLLVGISYQLYQTVASFFPQVLISMAAFNLLITIILIFLYLLVQRKGAHPVLLLSLHTVALSGLTYFWMNYGGMSGTAPSFYCLYTAFIIVCSYGIARWVITITLCLILGLYFTFPGLLNMQSFSEPEKINLFQRNVDYLAVGGLIIVFALYMKRKFVFYRESVSMRHQQLDRLAMTLQGQNQEIAMRQEETRAINENLESMVAERKFQIENKNTELAEYAFINAHMLRAPLCRILGLISLMEKEPEQYPNDQLVQIKSIAQEIDRYIKEINKVVS
jgi:signal transduction histidine kinase